MALAQKTKLSDAIIEEMTRMLISGELKEGSKLPNQNAFAEQLGVSRLTLREALHTLQLMGLIEQAPRKGTIIVNGNPDLWSKQIDAPALYDIDENLDLIYARNVIENGLAKRAVKNATQADIDRIGEIYNTMKKAVSGSASEYATLDASFHMALASASKNKYLVHMLAQLAVMNEQFLSHAYEFYPSLVKESMRYHTNIYSAIVERNEAKYIRAMKEHLKNTDALANSMSGTNK